MLTMLFLFHIYNKQNPIGCNNNMSGPDKFLLELYTEEWRDVFAKAHSGSIKSK